MIIVFFILIILTLFIVGILFSTLNIRVEKLYFSNQSLEKLKWNYFIVLELSLFGMIKAIKLRIDPKRVEKILKKRNIKEKVKEINFKQIKQDLPDKEEQVKLMKRLKIKLEEFHFVLELGTKDVLITSAMIAFLSSVLGIAIARVIKKYQEEKYEYKMIPVYQNKNIINLNLNCIIQVKMVHIICIIFTLLRKRKEKQKHERTSNRRSYDYSYEQY
ncbi:MAG: hypothetical protein HFJ26_03630 [Clostridia bacterium]|nr:hypothetical protein [Clostridia bacterium]